MSAKNSGSGLDGNLSSFGCWNVRTVNGREQELVDREGDLD